jgi:hypothetical protein
VGSFPHDAGGFYQATHYAVRLAPGSLIKERRDRDIRFEDGKMHIPIPVVTNEGVDFRPNGTRSITPAGSSWYPRLFDPHSVANRGGTVRVHRVIDGAVNAWVAALFEQATLPVPA